MTTLIVDLGNCHFGNFDNAKELIRISYESGADLVKGQAFCHEDINGSMPKEFYKQCQFSFEQYLELIEYANNLNIPFFYSIFSTKLYKLKMFQKYQKIAAGQSSDLSNKDLLFLDDDNYFISFKSNRDKFPNLKKATALLASDYLVENPSLHNLYFFKNIFYKYGYSDHTIGIKNCILAVKKYGAQVIEKHICLAKHEEWGGQVFRDTIHSALPNEIEVLAKNIKE